MMTCQAQHMQIDDSTYKYTNKGITKNVVKQIENNYIELFMQNIALKQYALH